MKNLLKYLPIVLLLFAFRCSKKTEPDPTLEEENTTEFQLGWNGEDDVNSIPTSTNFGFGNGGLSSSVSLLQYFPPIGNQGQYGTCVSWAVGYNGMTATNGIKNALSSSQLSSPNNQFSPKDLFLAIPNSQKNPDCGGTNFSDALNVLQSRGVASMQTVPYDNLGNCSQGLLQSSWTNEAGQNKIKYWRKIDPSIESIKQNLSNNIPVIFGAKLSDNFMSWNSNDVITSNTTYNTVGQHSYHAMIIGGYDDNKGPNGAFKVVNSWGQFWGDGGYIWVDYNFFITQFCVGFNGDKPIFIMADDEGSNPPNDPDPNVSGVDLAPWVFSDYSNYQNSGNPWERVINFNLYNIGNQIASPDSNWTFYYIYFNAYNANEYGVLFYDQFNTSVAPNTYYCPTNYNCIFNYSINPGANFSQTVFGLQSIPRTYYMPQITGLYYLVLVADAEDRFQEQDELNNLFYTTINPIYFENGYGLFGPSNDDNRVNNDSFRFQNSEELKKQNLEKSKFNTIVTPKNRNAYTQEEILSFLKKEVKNGNLDKKVNKSIQNGKASYNDKQ